MKIYDTYGLKADDFESVLPAIEQAVCGRFETRESYYHGGTYYCFGKDPGKENFVIQRNFNPAEEEWEEEDFEDMGILLYVNNTRRAEMIRRTLVNAMPEIVLIRRREVPEKSDEAEIRYSRAVA
ncbi:hypothetical protein QUF72_11025 [Desulfobacterales bacterium HSG2]|nr:hypothetical protein [Desulfobacterales bacterium HSG2]